MNSEAQRLAEEIKAMFSVPMMTGYERLKAFEAIDRLASLQSADQARDAARLQTLEDQIRLILKGIDEDECLSEEGWWETSSGVEFGTERLRLVVEAIRAMATKESR